jgi:Ca2+-binding EF-hand superfamily protein
MRLLKKQTLKTLALASAGAVALIAIPALAQGPKADLNQDGQVTKAEFMANSAEKFTRADVNFDGFIDESERKGLREQGRADRTKRAFGKLDANNDGVVTEAEMLAAQEERGEKRSDRREARKAERLERFDTDGDGVLSDAEKETARAARKEARGDKKGFKRDGKGKRGKRMNPDTDGDGLISQAEFSAGAEALFLKMDANGDGVLTKGEGRKGKKGKRRK